MNPKRLMPVIAVLLAAGGFAIAQRPKAVPMRPQKAAQSLRKNTMLTSREAQVRSLLADTRTRGALGGAAAKVSLSPEKLANMALNGRIVPPAPSLDASDSVPTGTTVEDVDWRSGIFVSPYDRSPRVYVSRWYPNEPIAAYMVDSMICNFNGPLLPDLVEQKLICFSSRTFGASQLEAGVYLPMINANYMITVHFPPPSPPVALSPAQISLVANVWTPGGRKDFEVQLVPMSDGTGSIGLLVANFSALKDPSVGGGKESLVWLNLKIAGSVFFGGFTITQL
jgi:hypothetical protein